MAEPHYVPAGGATRGVDYPTKGSSLEENIRQKMRAERDATVAADNQPARISEIFAELESIDMLLNVLDEEDKTLVDRLRTVTADERDHEGLIAGDETIQGRETTVGQRLQEIHLRLEHRIQRQRSLTERIRI